MLLEAETSKYCPGGYDIGAISNLITWVLNFFFECILVIKISAVQFSLYFVILPVINFTMTGGKVL